MTFFDAQVRKVSYPSKPALDGPVLQQRTGTLDQQQRARSEGAQRTGGYDSARTSGYGQG